jgi:hypothetical protein
LLPQSDYQLLPNGQQWQLRHEEQPLLTLTLNGQRLTWQATRPLQPTEWQELAHRLQTIFSQFPLYLAEPPQIAPPAPWQPAPQGWQLGTGV